MPHCRKSGDANLVAYDARGEPVEMHFSVAGAPLHHRSLEHDELGRIVRVSERWYDVTERGWLYGDGVSPVAELDGAGALMNRHVHATRGHVPDLVLRGDTAHRVVTDHLGSVRAVVRTTDGLVVQRREYDAWGVLTADTGGVFQSLGYAGGLTDTATRLVRFGARDYDAEVGRWTTKDPIGFAGGDANLYAYAGNVPSSRVDPTGLATYVALYPGPFRQGHVGIGFHPNSTVGLNPGVPLQQRFPLLLGGDVPGVLLEDDPGERLRLVFLDTTPEQEARIREVMRQYAGSPDLRYKLVGQHCGDFVRDALLAAGIVVDDGWRPNELFQNLEKSKGRTHAR